ncbi:hypothetical protein [Pseudomonas phoenicis]|uniref:hypothetical protein n=1 Tax=unclassified Pseudomonas TaxID=196821 RepID=UPI0039A28D3A
MSDALYGTTTVQLGARFYTLKPTLDAALRIEARFGGLRGALEAMRLMSIAACADIVIAGAALKPEDHKTIANEVFETGVSKVSVQLTNFISVLLNPVPPSVVEQGKPGAGSTAQ